MKYPLGFIDFLIAFCKHWGKAGFLPIIYEQAGKSRHFFSLAFLKHTRTLYMETQFLMESSSLLFLYRHLEKRLIITLKFNLKSSGNDSMSLTLMTWVITHSDLMFVSVSSLLFNYWEEMSSSQHTWQEERAICLRQWYEEITDY